MPQHASSVSRLFVARLVIKRSTKATSHQFRPHQPISSQLPTFSRAKSDHTKPSEKRPSATITVTTIRAYWHYHHSILLLHRENMRVPQRPGSKNDFFDGGVMTAALLENSPSVTSTTGGCTYFFLRLWRRPEVIRTEQQPPVCHWSFYRKVFWKIACFRATVTFVPVIPQLKLKLIDLVHVWCGW